MYIHKNLFIQLNIELEICKDYKIKFFKLSTVNTQKIETFDHDGR